jgi:hypothetical protein
MSAKGATLARRGTVHLPIWPVVALLVVAVATPIGLSVIDDVRNGGQAVTSIQETEGYWNSTIAHPAVRGRGYATTDYVGISHVAPRAVGYATPDKYVSISHVAPHSVGYAPDEGTSVPTTNPCPLACQQARR